MYTYEKIVKVAKEIKKNVQSNQKLGKTTKWSYYIGKAILNPHHDVKKIPITKAVNPQQSKISQTVKSKEYLALIRQYIEFIELNNRLPDYIAYKNHKIKPQVLTYVFSKILRYQNKYGKLPETVNISYKVFKKPVTTNEAYEYFIKNFKKVNSVDEALQIISNEFDYEYYYDDKKTNKQVIKDRAGNCTDLTQMLANIGEALDYKVKCIHVQCRTSGTGHVFLKLKHDKYTEGSWITRDPSAVCGGNSVTNIWCSNGYVLAENPSWWLENKYR